MSKHALPCIACGRQLVNVDETATNQPYCGTAFETHGHYGSTVHDSLDGYYLEINICDLCLVQHADRVLTGRDSRPVIEDGSVVGREQLAPPWRLTPWRVDAKTLDWVLEQARKEFALAADDDTEEPH